MDKDTEIMVLRHQVLILERQLNARGRLSPVDRSLAALSRLLPRWRWRSFLVTPETLLRWHRGLLWAQMAAPAIHSWPWSGRPCPMSSSSSSSGLPRENRRWGCVRIEGELRGLEVPRTKTPAVPR